MVGEIGRWEESSRSEAEEVVVGREVIMGSMVEEDDGVVVVKMEESKEDWSE